MDKIEYTCRECGKRYTEDDFMFRSFANPHSCDDCERQHREDATSD